MKTNFNIELHIIDTAFVKLEAFVKKYALNTDEVKSFTELLKSGFLSTLEGKMGKKKVTILTFKWEKVDDVLLSLLQRFGKCASDQNFVMGILQKEVYGSLFKHITFEEDKHGKEKS